VAPILSPRVHEVIERYRRFYASDRGGLMVRCSCDFGVPWPGTTPLNKLDWEDEAAVRAYARAFTDYVKALIRARAGVDDDYLPGVQVLAGTGMVAAAFVADAVLHMEKDTNYLDPPINSWRDGFDQIGFRPENPWYRAQMKVLSAYIDEWDGSFAICPYTHFDPLDLANQFRGNNLFYDFTEEEGNLRALLKRCTESVLALEADIHASHLRGYALPGTGIGGLWIPAGNYLSCDAGDMMSPAQLEQWGLPCTESLCRHWGGAYMHHHELGAHQLQTWSRCDKLCVQFLNRDPNTRHMPELIDSAVIESTFRVAVHFIATYADFMAHAEEWRHGKFCTTVICENPQEARAVARKLPALRNF